MHPLLLTGPPAVGKTTTARAVASLRPRAAVIDVDDIRQLVIAGHAAPWEGEEGRRQQRLGVENSCDLAQRLRSAGIDVVLADVVTVDTLAVYRRRVPDLVVAELEVSLAEARRRAGMRPASLTDQEFEDLHAAARQQELAVDVVVDVGKLTRDEQATAVMLVWQEAAGEPRGGRAHRGA